MPGKRLVTFTAVRRALGAHGLLALLLTCASARAQEYSLRNFAGSEGLANLSIQKLYQDRTGFLWVGTENGVFRYDGARFESFGPAQGLPSAGGVAFAETQDGKLLVGASIGLYRFNGKRFEQIPTPFKTVAWTQGIQTDAAGHTYLATDSGLFEMTSTASQAVTFRRLYPAPGTPDESIHGVFVEGETLWFGCGVKLCRLESEKPNAGLKVFGEEAGLLKVALAAIVKDHDGNLWVRARNEGVLEWPAGEPRFRRPDTPVPGSALTGTPALDRDGHILLGTSDGLLLQKAKGWQLLDKRAGLRGGVYTALEDRQHSLWMGTGGRGLVEWRGYREWESYSSATGLPTDTVFEMLSEADGTVWAATEAGLAHGIPGANGLTWTTVPGTAGIAVHSLQRTVSGDLWIGTASKGIGLIPNGTGPVEWFDAKQGLTGRRALTIRFDHNGQFWAATETGLFVSQPPYRTFNHIDAVPSTWIWTVAEGADGTLWAGGDSGLFALSAGHWQHWDQSNGLTNQGIVSLGAARDGSVWIGYQHGGGIDRVHLSPSGLVIQNKVQRPGSDGLIYFLNFDRDGHLWAGTERGLDMWNGAHWSHYDTTDGLVWDDCNLGGFAQSPDGTLWFGTAGGISLFKPRPVSSAAASPRVLFTQLSVGQNDLLGRQNPSLPISSGALLARFSAPDAVQDSSRLFRYRLEGDRSPWTETTQQQLESANLASGNYDLQVQVRNSQGIWSPQAAEFAFSIQPPWYRRAWFLALLMLVPFLCAVITFRIRSLSAERRERQLQQLVDEKTRDLRNANEELLRLTMVDPLTGVANRRHFDQTLALECGRVERSGSPLSLILIDVDHFKFLNDSAGHQKGDEYLVLLGRQLAQTARRQIDLVARIGGEEFALILPATSASEAAAIAEALRRNVEELKLPHPASPVAESLTVSIGVATTTPEQHSSPEELMRATDQALYRAKSLGRNRVQFA